MSEPKGVRVLVMHEGYGCDTGCCGHAVKIVDADEIVADNFAFEHPRPGEDPREFAKRLVTEELGPDHVADLDWSRSCIIDDWWL